VLVRFIVVVVFKVEFRATVVFTVVFAVVFAVVFVVELTITIWHVLHPACEQFTHDKLHKTQLRKHIL
jgi:hypothetical protein